MLQNIARDPEKDLFLIFGMGLFGRVHNAAHLFVIFIDFDTVAYICKKVRTTTME